jgi:hypothetical protein
MVQDFFNAYSYFELICAEQKKNGLIAYHLLDAWVGSEITKGPLWDLKDHCHRLLRNNESKTNPYEPLFDWTIGSIFHETIKLKEDAYQLEAYRPLLDLEIYKKDQAVADIIDEYLTVIENAYSSLNDELLRIRQLFLKALSHLKAIFPSYRNNMLLVRFLLDYSRKPAHRVPGKEYFSTVLSCMFPEGLQTAYLAAAEYCIAVGGHHDAARYLKRVLAQEPHNAAAQVLLQKIAMK